MPRMFDILRGGESDNSGDVPREIKNNASYGENDKDKCKKTAKDGDAPKDEQVNFPKKILESRETEKVKNPKNYTLASKKLISAIKKDGFNHWEQSKGVYESALVTVTTLLEKVRKKEEIASYMDKVYQLLSNIFNQLILEDSVLNDIYEEKKKEYYLPYHIVNILFLSSFLGIKTGLNKSKMRDLGLACILCDVGVDEFRKIIDKPITLTDGEYNLVRKHITISLRVAEEIGQVKDIVKDAIRMHHERVDGSGYPRGIESEKINPYAKIIGVVDTYEAITHNRPYRDGSNAHTAIKYLLDSLKNTFDYEVMKVLIDKMSMYPIGTIVKLDTDEIARVIGVTQGSPLKPIVMVIRDAYGTPLKGRKIIDLSTLGAPSIIDSN